MTEVARLLDRILKLDMLGRATLIGRLVATAPTAVEEALDAMEALELTRERGAE